MPPGSRFLVAISLTSIKHSLCSSNFYVHCSRSRYSSIADAMLGRATQNFEAAKSKDLAKPVFASNSPVHDAKIDEQFKKGRQSQSIGAFTSYTNTSNPLRSKSPNIRPVSKQSASSSSRWNGSASNAPTIFSREDSFRNTPETVDLTQEEVAKPPPVEFDLEDFEDDADIDLDVEYELPLSMPPPSSKQKTTPSLLPQNGPTYPPSSQASQHLNSSARIWTSSPPENKLTPEGAKKRRRQEELAKDNVVQTKEVKENHPPNKRRTLPWLQNKAAEDQIASDQEESEEISDLPSSAAEIRCINCRKFGHAAKVCPERSKGIKGSAYGYKPPDSAYDAPKDSSTPKEKRMPWNSTGSAVAEKKRDFFKAKAARKVVESVTQNKLKGRVTMAAVTLSEEQRRVLDLVTKQDKSVFFTGSAGTGKSVLMRSIIGELRKKYVREPDRVAVTASTGLAACNIGGVTLHSFGGIGLGKEDVPVLVKKIKRNAKAKNRWLRTKVLIIDEISMVDGDLFDKLEGIARAMRNNGRPFGGIQLVITGDFFQLPPVPDHEKKGQGVKFAFDAGTWATAIHHTIGLTEVFRQKDPVFANMLNEMRLGKISNDTIAAFRKLSRKIKYEDSLEATELFPTRNEVENANAFRMRSLVGKSYFYNAKDSGSIADETMREKLLSNMMASKTLELKKGAQVMLIKNIDEQLVNGSLGKIVAFMDEKTYEITNEEPEIIDYDIPMEELSERGRRLRASLSLRDASSETAQQLYPRVRFTLQDGTFRDLLVQPEDWKVELPNGEIQAQRSQLPLILAWALSIHKAQGQTLERVKIDLKKIFEKGQAYVALSRATSQAGLEVQNFDQSKVMAHPRVAQFYNSLYSVNKALEHPKVAQPPAIKKAKTYEEEFMVAKNSHIPDLDFEEEERLMADYA